MPCSACGDELPANARYCPSCGTRHVTEDVAAPESRKVVTVLFCDLVGSTALSGGLDPETLRAVTLRYFDLMHRQIGLYGGTVEKFIGDAVMAVFGVPVVHEDDARRALAAALSMTAALEELNAELHATLGIRLDVRIGVNTGQVVSGSDASAGQALISGETVNVAARLEQHAGPGRILIGPDTLRSAGAAVRAEPVGALSLKGKVDPFPAYRLLGLDEDDPQLQRRFDLRFVGRSAELASLDAALAEVTATRGARRVLVHGEAGMGKTRLVREWLHTRAPRHGSGRCRQYGEQGSLGPLGDAITALLETDRTAVKAGEALRVLAGGILLDGTPNPSVEDTCAALVQVLVALSAPRPVVLVIDDCHWAGDLLLDVLDRLVADLDRAAVLIVCVTRPELLERRPALVTDARGRNLGLKGLSPHDCAVLATEMVDVAAHWDSVPDRLLERAGGNPLHLEQLLAAATESGSQDELPHTVQSLLGSRIDALPARERRILDHASVIGREFTTDDLAALCGDHHEIRAALLRLSRRRLVEPGPQSSFRFTSGLVQEVTYACMSKRARAEGHERAAALPFVQAAGQAAIGGHLERAYVLRRELGVLDDGVENVRRRAADALGRAGAQALARSDLPWAEDLLSRSTALRRDGEPRGAADVRRLGEVRVALGRTEEGRVLLERVLSTSADAVEQAHARLSLAVLAPAQESPALVAAAVMPVFVAAGDELGQARACLRLAQQCQSEGRHGAADRWLTRALARAVDAGGEQERAAALGAIGISLWRGPLPVPQATARCRSLLEEHGPGRRTVRMTLNCPLAVLYALQHRWTAARQCLAEAGRLAEELGYAETRVVIPLFGALVEIFADRRDQARSLLNTATTSARELGATVLLDTVLVESARLHLDGADVSAAADILARLRRVDTRTHAETADIDGLLARVAAARAQGAEALRLAAHAVSSAARTDSPVVRAVARLDEAHALRALGMHDRAERAARAAEAVFVAQGHLPGARRARTLLDERIDRP
ncbi:adenylate/guanylate cyclase domain-containing protein [Streptomyces griseorubiginosus]|uniref:AAA family ATPase n=1 Tax=Streptomyces griseorubiginosus TaxID=67304 RepID=UPI0033AE7C51